MESELDIFEKYKFIGTSSYSNLANKVRENGDLNANEAKQVTVVAESPVVSDLSVSSETNTPSKSNALLSDSINRWKEPASSNSRLNLEDDYSDDYSLSDVSSSDHPSAAKKPKVSADEELSNLEVSDNEEEVDDQSDISEYKPSSESEEEQWLSKKKAKRLAAERRRHQIAKELQAETKMIMKQNSNAKQVYSFTKAQSSFDMLRKLRRERKHQQKKEMREEFLAKDCLSEKEEEEEENSINDGEVESKIGSPVESVAQKPAKETALTVKQFFKRRFVLSSDEEETGDSVACTTSSAVKEEPISVEQQAKHLRRVVYRSDEGEESDVSKQDSYSSSTKDENYCDESVTGSDDVDETVEDVDTSVKLQFKKPTILKQREMEAKCLQFFRSAEQSQLIALPRCSERMAKVIVEQLRPFESYNDMIEKFENAKGFSTSLCTAYIDSLRSQNRLDFLLYKCHSVSSKLEMEVQLMMKTDDGLIKQPNLISHNLELKPYQLVGLNWLSLIYRQNLGGILADEMGLGKTIQVIAFLAYLKENNLGGPTFIIVPSSTLDNWLREIQKWCPSLKLLTYYGSPPDRAWIRRQYYNKRVEADVILTTYTSISCNAEDRHFMRRVLADVAIFDEAHMLKNYRTHRYKQLMSIKTKHRILLTGTPLQNSLIELISLLYFIMPKIFRKLKIGLNDMSNLFQLKNISSPEGEQFRIEQAKKIVSPFTLRRLKSDVLHQLPEKHEKLQFCELTDLQREIYSEIVAECTEILKSRQENNCSDAPSSSSSSSSSGRLTSMIMKLRKAANHPLLLRWHYKEKKLNRIAKVVAKEKFYKNFQFSEVVEDLMLKSDFEIHKLCCQHKKLNRLKLSENAINDSGKLIALDGILAEAKQQGNKVLLFSQFVIVLDVLEEFLTLKQIRYLRLDGQTPVVERQPLIDMFNSSEDIFIFLLSTRAGGLGINLTSANVIVLYDIDYNPHNDRQAEDRCHRVGQKKDVHVIKLISKNTVDESMLACANKKLELERQITTADSAGTEYIQDILLQQLLLSQ
ncbi:SWI/SNF-related matrix-associated actin-dependent regulator of chromatin subfamily A containing DEAD/H box 1B [Trichinella pseudospiralis]|nr:SWI/SNF-related matrix-associated actin-dependent regulator of chromatin subfamily A containing DEAD/H box 1B [Trichinella pseudospiralis]KRZ24870.1 SWI/SNF-related matrix-associated actin-dependent regulator of chromatin subfamily A containing DEAD/H box 1B [Trichinella pseudospiralis]KRZ41231.1 SWI/SNF-related matrix-associated actin-dependent regulator of chromatin subfamily A containing DEAD/H box 1B [Trichinella pseudospiralis]